MFHIGMMISRGGQRETVDRPRQRGLELLTDRVDEHFGPPLLYAGENRLRDLRRAGLIPREPGDHVGVGEAEANPDDPSPLPRQLEQRVRHRPERRLRRAMGTPAGGSGQERVHIDEAPRRSSRRSESCLFYSEFLSSLGP
jgi:hypothetical protein